MQTNPANELLLTTLADRDSRNRTGRLKLGRLIALFAGIATVLLMAGHHPANASGLSGILPEGAGFSISVPLGDVSGAAARPTVGVFALVGSDEPVAFDLDRPSSAQRVAFAPVAVAGGIAGVATWPSNRIETRRASRDARTVAKRRTASRGQARNALSSPPVSRPRAAASGVSKVDARRKARLATLSYQRMLRQYHLMPQDAPKARAHAKLMRAYRVALAWRKYSGIK